jgi:hypothetical protein
MATAIAPLTIIAALGAALALAPQGGDAGSPSGHRPKPETSFRVSTSAPIQILPGVAQGRGDPSLDPELSRAVRRTRASVARAGVDPKRDLLAPLSSLTLSLEASCPPPAVLACRPAVRLTGQLDGGPPPGYERDLQTAIVAGLREAGFRGVRAQASDRGRLAGRATSQDEVLARWRLEDDALEVTTAGLPLDEPSAPARD